MTYIFYNLHISEGEEDAAFLERGFLAPRYREAKLDMEAVVFEQILKFPHLNHMLRVIARVHKTEAGIATWGGG